MVKAKILRFMFATCTLLSTYIYADSLAISPDEKTSEIKPMAEYDRVLVDNPNASISDIKTQQVLTLNTVNGNHSGTTFNLMSSNSTYTYLRCYYKEINNSRSHDERSPYYDYVWGRVNGLNCNIFDSSGCYKVYGNWATGDTTPISNMFITNVSQNELRNVCVNTLTQDNKPVSSIFVYVANNKYSWNYETWGKEVNNNAKFTHIVSFGDSLSDTQTMYSGSNWQLPANGSWALGHFSNGYVWTEYLAQNLNLSLNNWATGGAKGSTDYYVIPGLKDQVNSWVKYMHNLDNNSVKQSLITMWIGANDLLGGRCQALFKKGPP